MLRPKSAVLRVILLVEFFVLIAIPQARLKAQDTRPASSTASVGLKALSDSTRRVVFDPGAFSGVSAAMPQWDNGYLVSREVETFESGVPNVRLYDESGKLVRVAAIWFSAPVRLPIHPPPASPHANLT